MKIALLADGHAGVRSDSTIFNDYFLDFYEKQFFPYLKENNIKTVVHLGDIWDRRKYINFNTLKEWRQRFFEPLHDIVDTMHIILGNHDVVHKNNNDINSCEELLRFYHKFEIYKEPTEIQLDQLKVLCLPWICDENSVKAADAINTSDATVCMGHLELDGFDVMAGHAHIGGMNPTDLYRFEQVFSGHFHHKQKSGNIEYLGSPYPMYWSDYGDMRGFHIYDTETKEIEFIENPSQIFHKTYYNDAKENYSDIQNQDHSHLSGKYVKVVVQKKTNPFWFDSFIEVLTKSGAADVSVVDAHFESDELEEGSEQEIENDAKDTLEMVMDYVQDLQFDDTTTDRIKEILRNAYIEAVNTNLDVQSV